MHSTADISPEDIERKGYGKWLNRINQFFQSDEILSESYQFQELTETALGFDMEGVEVELMVSPHWGNPGDFYSFLESIIPQNRSK